MADSLSGAMHKATTWSIVLSVLMIIAGALAIFAPQVAGVTVTALVGWLLIISGMLHLGYAWGAGRPSAVLWEVLLGIVYGGIGFYLLSRPLIGLASLTFALALFLCIKGVIEFILAFRLRPMSGSGWLLFDGLITIALAILILSAWPASSLWAVGMLVGISMFFSGLTRLMMTITVRQLVA